jgi:hypothetical protein
MSVIPLSEKRARYETALANAHKWSYIAEQRAEELRYVGCIEDLRQIQYELTRIAGVALDRQPGYKPLRGQLALDGKEVTAEDGLRHTKGVR